MLEGGVSFFALLTPLMARMFLLHAQVQARHGAQAGTRVVVTDPGDLLAGVAAPFHEAAVVEVGRLREERVGTSRPRGRLLRRAVAGQGNRFGARARVDVRGSRLRREGLAGRAARRAGHGVRAARVHRRGELLQGDVARDRGGGRQSRVRRDQAGTDVELGRVERVQAMGLIVRGVLGRGESRRPDRIQGCSERHSDRSQDCESRESGTMSHLLVPF